MTPRRHAETPGFVSVPSAGEVESILVRPDAPRALMAFAHGAGAGISHSFMTACAQQLADHGIATLRYNFPYMERQRSGGRRPPDRAPVLIETVQAAVRRARAVADDLPLLAGGKSLGGRMTSMAAAAAPLSGVSGIVFFGFPLHPPRRPAVDRAAHLEQVPHPMLFLQGTRDALADLGLLRPVLEGLGEAATLEVVEGADHGFGVLKRSGRTDEEVLDGLAASVARWAAALPGAAAGGPGRR